MITAAITLSGTKRSRKRISQQAYPKMALNTQLPPFHPTTLRSASRMVPSRFTMRPNCTGTGTFRFIITTTSTNKAATAAAVTTLPFGKRDLLIHHNSIPPSKSTPTSFLPLTHSQAKHPSKPPHPNLRIWLAREGSRLLLPLNLGCPPGRLVRKVPFSRSNRSIIITIPMLITP